MTQADDDAKAKSLTKDQTEHAKFLVERNKEIYKYTFESTKFLDSKISRLLTIITFLFTLQTALVSVFFFKMEGSFFKWILFFFILLAYWRLLVALHSAVDTSAPRKRAGLQTTDKDTLKECADFSDDMEKTLALNANFARSLAIVIESTIDKNQGLATDISKIGKEITRSYWLVGLCVLLASIVSLFSPLEASSKLPHKSEQFSMSESQSNQQNKPMPIPQPTSVGSADLGVTPPTAKPMPIPKPTNIMALYDSVNSTHVTPYKSNE